jgi:hypothetical protein
VWLSLLTFLAREYSVQQIRIDLSMNLPVEDDSLTHRLQELLLLDPFLQKTQFLNLSFLQAHRVRYTIHLYISYDDPTLIFI